MNKIPLVLLISFFTTFCTNAQHMNRDGKEYHIRDYMFIPEYRSIHQNTYFVEDIKGPFGKSMGHAWGYNFEHRKDLNYDSTFLMIVGGIIHFKEELDVGNIPYKNPVLQYNSSYEAIYEVSQNDSTYLVHTYGGSAEDIKVLDISDFTRVDKLLYQNKEGDYLYFSPQERRLILADNEAEARKLILSASENSIQEEPDLILKGHFSYENDTLYFPLKENPTEGKLLKKENKYFFTQGGYADKEIKSVQIYNFSKNEFEEFEEDKYRPIGDFFFYYKNVLFAKGNVQRPVANVDSINVEQLKPLTSEYNGNGCFYTDGEKLIYVSSKKYYDEDYTPERYLSLDKYIIRNVDFKTLQVLTYDILADKDNIYSAFTIPQQEIGVNIIPLDKLGMDVRIYTELE